MKEVRVPAAVVEAIRLHGEETYPEECCGFLIGRDDRTVRRIERVTRAPNRVTETRERRYTIEAADLMALERSLEGSSERLVGIYHSHPNHPARPSTFDEEHAWPWYTYIVFRVEAGRAAELGAFELGAEDGLFAECPLAVERADPALTSP